MSEEKHPSAAEKPEAPAAEATQGETPQPQLQAKFGDRDPGWTERDVPSQQGPAKAKSTDTKPTSEAASEQVKSQAKFGGRDPGWTERDVPPCKD